MKKLVLLVAVTGLAAYAVWAQKVWTGWDGAVEIYPRQLQFARWLDIPDGPTKCTCSGYVSTSVAVGTPDTDNEHIYGTTYPAPSSGYSWTLSVFESRVRSTGLTDTSAVRSWLDLSSEAGIEVSFGGQVGMDTSTFFFTHAGFAVHAEAADSEQQRA